MLARGIIRLKLEAEYFQYDETPPKDVDEIHPVSVLQK
jgi:hypothetical protein